MYCCRHSSDLALLWLWHRRPAAVAPIRPLAWKPPYAVSVVLKRQRKKKKFFLSALSSSKLETQVLISALIRTQSYTKQTNEPTIIHNKNNHAHTQKNLARLVKEIMEKSRKDCYTAYVPTVIDFVLPRKKGQTLKIFVEHLSSADRSASNSRT